MTKKYRFLLMLCMGAMLLPALCCAETPAMSAAMPLPEGSILPWWGWCGLLFVTTFLIGIVAVIGGVGGGVLFVPIVGGFFPFHLDFVRGAGLFLALACALSSGPSLLRSGMANLRLVMPLALVASMSSIFGAIIGLALPEKVIETALGLTIIAIAVLMFLAKRADFPVVEKQDRLARMLDISGLYHDPSLGRDVAWQVHRTPLGLVLFAMIGILGGMFGLGAGWANVPVLNLVMGTPLKVAAASSGFLISIANTSATWVYLNNGAVMAVITVPAVIGIMLGAKIGQRLLLRVHAATVKKVVVTMLFLAGLRAFLKGTGLWS